MSDLSPETRALLEAARGGLGPDAAAVKRMRAGVAAKVGSGGLANMLGPKSALVALVATIGIGALVYAQRSATAVVPAHRHELDALVTPVRPDPVERTARAAHAEELDVAIELEPQAARPLDAERSPGRHADQVRKAVANLDREVALIDRATTMLAAGNPLRAITTIKRYETETNGRGQLAEEAAAIDVEATCTAALASATPKLAAFTLAFPRSAQIARLQKICE